jgi:hypothetical protein
MRCRHCQFLCGVGENIHMIEITYTGETYIKFLGGPHRFLLVHWLNFCFVLVHSSSSDMFFKIAK